MKITHRQLKKIIIEAMPPGGVPDIVGAVTGVYGEEERQLLNDLGGMYSDMHKELYRRRPRIPMFKTIEEAEAAVEEIWGAYAAKNRARESQEKADLEFIEMERKMQEMMPGEYDYEHVPKRSGMGRRMENRMRVTKRQLKRIIAEEIHHIKEWTETWDPEAPSRPGGPEDPAMRMREEPSAVEAVASQLLNLMSLIDQQELRSINGGDEILMVVDDLRKALGE